MLKYLYRIIAPKHPGGRIDVFHESYDNHGVYVGKIFTNGMSRWNLNDLEIIDAPNELVGYAHGLIYEFTGYMKNHKPFFLINGKQWAFKVAVFILPFDQFHQALLGRTCFFVQFRDHICPYLLVGPGESGYRSLAAVLCR